MARDSNERASTDGERAWPKAQAARYSLKGLLLAIACIAVVLGACRWSYDKAVERHQHDLYWSNRLGEEWYLGWKQTAWGAITDRDLAPVERARCGSFLGWPPHEVKSSDLECLAHFSELKALRLFLVDVDEEGGRLLAQCKSLKKLDASHTNLTDAFVQHIGDLPLERVYLSKTKITVESLATLAKMPELRGREAETTEC